MEQRLARFIVSTGAAREGSFPTQMSPRMQTTISIRVWPSMQKRTQSSGPTQSVL